MPLSVLSATGTAYWVQPLHFDFPFKLPAFLCFNYERQPSLQAGTLHRYARSSSGEACPLCCWKKGSKSGTQHLPEIQVTWTTPLFLNWSILATVYETALLEEGECFPVCAFLLFTAYSLLNSLSTSSFYLSTRLFHCLCKNLLYSLCLIEQPYISLLRWFPICSPSKPKLKIILCFA